MCIYELCEWFPRPTCTSQRSNPEAELQPCRNPNSRVGSRRPASVTDRIRRLQGVVWDRFGMKRLVARVECVCRVRRAWDNIIVDPDIPHMRPCMHEPNTQQHCAAAPDPEPDPSRTAERRLEAQPSTRGTQRANLSFFHVSQNFESERSCLRWLKSVIGTCDLRPAPATSVVRWVVRAVANPRTP